MTVSKQSLRHTRSDVSMAALDEEHAKEMPTSQDYIAFMSARPIPQKETVWPIRRYPLTMISRSIGIDRYTMFYCFISLLRSNSSFWFGTSNAVLAVMSRIPLNLDDMACPDTNSFCMSGASVITYFCPRNLQNYLESPVMHSTRIWYFSSRTLSQSVSDRSIWSRSPTRATKVRSVVSTSRLPSSSLAL